MAWSNVKTVGLVLEHDHIHDFSSGYYDIPVSLDLTTGSEEFYAEMQPGATGAKKHYVTENLSVSTEYGFALLVDNLGDGTVNGLQTHWTPGSIGISGITTCQFTKITFLGPADPNRGSLSGPYTLRYYNSGLVHPTFYLYEKQNPTSFPHNGFIGSFTPLIPLPQLIVYSFKTFPVNIFQKAVAVTTKDSSTGVVLSDGMTINADTIPGSNTIILNKTNNRGDTYSIWTITKQNPTTGAYTAAIGGGTDYSFTSAGNVLTDDEITLTWVSVGNYKVTNSVTGTSSITSGSNTGALTTNFIIGQSIIDTITLPTVISTLTGVVAYNNTTISTNPLEGIAYFNFTAEGILDLSSASWMQQTGSNPIVSLTLSYSDWLAEVTSKCDILCKVKQGTTTLLTKSGLGPHEFTLNTGSYTAGFELIPKVGLVLIATDIESIPAGDNIIK